MGSRFEDDFAAHARPDLLGQFARTLKYITANGTVKIVEAIECDELDEMRAEPDGESLHDRKLFQVSDDPTDGIANPGPNDSVEIDGEKWAVEVLQTKQAGISLIRIIRRRQTIKSHESYRQERF